MGSLTKALKKEVIESYLNKVTKLNYDDMVEYMWNTNSVQSMITALNTTGQLYEGEDAEGKEFPYYSRTSQEIYGKPNTPIKLFDTGAFYDSFKVVVRGTIAEIQANPMKDGVNLEDKYKEFELYGLNEESKKILIETITNTIEDYTQKSLRVD